MNKIERIHEMDMAFLVLLWVLTVATIAWGFHKLEQKIETLQSFHEEVVVEESKCN